MYSKIYKKEKWKQEEITSFLFHSLLTEIVKDLQFKSKDMLHLNGSQFLEDSPIFKKNFFKKKSHIEEIKYNIEKHKVKKKYKMIFGHFPWGMRGYDPRKLSISSLKFIDSDGIGLFLMPEFNLTFRDRRFNYIQAIRDNGFKVLAVLKMPEKLNLSAMQTSLIFLSRENTVQETYFAKYQETSLQPKLISLGIQSIYDIKVRKMIDHHEPEGAKITKAICGLSPKDIDELIKRDANFYDGIEDNIDVFQGFEYWELDKEIKNLDTEYGGYKFIKLDEIARVKQTREEFKEIANSIYIPAIGRTEVLKKMPTLSSKKKPQNFFQIECNSEIVKSRYLYIFFNSELGQKTLERELSKYSGSTIRRLRLSDIKNLYIPLPNIGIQIEIIENINKLRKIKEVFSKIEKSLSIKPISSSAQLAKLDQIYHSSIKLSEPELVFNEIKKGESTNREFKQTFALDVKLKKRGDHIVQECVKTVAGFMNKSGGTLFIGVADNSEITGIEVEVGKTKLHKSVDKYMNTIKDILKKRIGSASLSNCDFNPVKIRGKTILKIECSQSDHEVFVEKDFYVRMGPSTNKLEGRELATFIKDRFN